MADSGQAPFLIRLLPSLTAALQAYQTRAAKSAHSFAHMVLLEAAVRGWSVTVLLLVYSL